MFSKLATTAISAVALSTLFVSAAPAQLTKRDVPIITRCVNSHDVALTWDDGPYMYEQDIAGRLAESGSKGTFFFNGNSRSSLRLSLWEGPDGRNS